MALEPWDCYHCRRPRKDHEHDICPLLGEKIPSIYSPYIPVHSPLTWPEVMRRLADYFPKEVDNLKKL